MFGNQFGSLRNSERVFGLVSLIRNGDFAQATRGDPIPLVSVSVFASVVHAVAQVEITQIYVNKEKNPIECIYYFPVDSNGAVTHFHAELDGRKIKGEVKENEEAKAQYNKAVEQRQTAFLAQENMPDIFKIQIGFLKPGSQVKIVIGYVTEVKNEKGSDTMRFFLPTTVAQRYTPPSQTNINANELRNMTYSDKSPAPLTIKVDVAFQGVIKTVESPTHQIQIQQSGPIPEKKNWNLAVIELNGEIADMDRDFVLLITPAENHKPRLYFEKHGDFNSMAVMTHFIPSFKLKETNAELIFVLDRSGSMGGESIALAKRALQMFLHSLPINCYFNIVGFGSEHEFLFPESAKYEDNSLKHALSYASQLNANLGGTEIFSPLSDIFQKPSIPGYLRQIFLITDGEVSNTEQIISLIKANSHKNRVFSLGIGDAASHHLVEEVANAGGGTSAFVTYKEKIDSKVIQQLKNSLQPSLTDVVVIWDGVTYTKKKPIVNQEKTLLGYGKPLEETDCQTQQFLQAPRVVPPIFDGSQMVMLGIFVNEYPTSVSITANTPDGPLSLPIPFTQENDVGSTGMLHKLAALKIVRELELEISSLKYSSVWFQNEDKEKKLKQKIINIACQNGIASKYTSFVAVDEGNKNSEDCWIMQTRHVPSQYPHGGLHSTSGFAFSAPQQFPGPKGPLFGQFSFAQGSNLFGQTMSFGSGKPAFGSGPTTFGSATTTFSSGTATFGSGPTTFGSGPTTFGFGARTMGSGQATSGTGTTFGSGQAAGSLQPAFGSGQPTFGSGQAAFGSGQAAFGSGQAAFGSGQAAFGSGQAAFGSGQPVFGSGPTTFGSGTTTFRSGTMVFGTEATALGSDQTLGIAKPAAPGNGQFSFNIGSGQSLFGSSQAAFGSGSTGFGFGSSANGSFTPGQSCTSAVQLEDKDSAVLESIVSLQSYMGFYKLDFALCCALSLEVSSLQSKAAENNWDENAWATALTLVYFYVKLPKQKDSWELIYDKAKKWLSMNYPRDMETMLVAAEQLINK